MLLLWQQQVAGVEIVVNDIDPATSSRRSQLFTCQRYDAREGVPRTLHFAFASCLKSIGIADDTDTEEGVNHTEDLFWGLGQKGLQGTLRSAKTAPLTIAEGPLAVERRKRSARLGQSAIGPCVLSRLRRGVK
jgi:hypothetical protein